MEDAVDLIQQNIKKEVIQKTPSTERSLDDFALSTRVESVLVGEGKDISVSTRDGHVTLTINKHVLRLSHLKKKLRKRIMRVPDVKGG